MRESRYDVCDVEFFYLLVAAVCKRYAFAEEDVFHNSHKLVGPRVVDAAWKVHTQHPSLLLLLLLVL